MIKRRVAASILREMTMSRPDHGNLARLLFITLVACAVCGSSVALAGVTKPGQNGATKNPVLHHPLHGAGSSHNPIVVAPNAARGPATSTLARRCEPPPCPAQMR